MRPMYRQIRPGRQSMVVELLAERPDPVVTLRAAVEYYAAALARRDTILGSMRLDRASRYRLKRHAVEATVDQMLEHLDNPLTRAELTVRLRVADLHAAIDYAVRSGVGFGPLTAEDRCELPAWIMADPIERAIERRRRVTTPPARMEN